MSSGQVWDFIVIGSGFGGSVSALRLAEKGYSVLVIEQGKRFGPQDYARSNWDLKRYLWAPLVGCLGIQKLTLFRDVLVLSGSGVGGGSLVYANTLMQPDDAFFHAPEWRDLGDWKATLAPHYETARRMLGATRNRHLTFVDDTLRACAESMEKQDTFIPTDVAVYFGTPGVEAPDPYFGGEGPSRRGCVLCGGCMVGCRHGAKNTLDKNYLYLAERRGVRILPLTRVETLKPAGATADGSEGYEVVVCSSTRRLPGGRTTYRAREVVMAAGVLGTLQLLLKARDEDKTLPRLSPRLGENVRTNSEVFTGVTQLGAPPGRRFDEGVAISSLFKPEPHTAIEPVRYPRGSSFMRLLATPLVDEPRGGLRTLKWAYQLVSRPVTFLRLAFNSRWAETSIIFLVMQNLDNRIHLRWKRSLLALGLKRLASERAQGAAPVPSEIPSANRFTRAFANAVGGVPQAAITQMTINVPTTAHILGGCAIGADAARGVIDATHRVHHYRGLYVCDGSAIPANLGVNPSLTITAMTEHAMAHIPHKSSIPTKEQL